MASADALREIEKPSSAAADLMRAAVGADTSSEPRSARDTVATETPARAATSAMVAICGSGTVTRSSGVGLQAGYRRDVVRVTSQLPEFALPGQEASVSSYKRLQIVSASRPTHRPRAQP